MADQQFISHARVLAPPSPVEKRAGAGIFSALAIILIVLGVVLTGGLVLLAKTFERNAEVAEKRLGELSKLVELESLKEVKNLELQIERAKGLLANHVYPSQSFNFVESHTLPGVRYSSFAYGDKKISLGAIAPSFTSFAQQVKYLRSVSDASGVSFSPPKLNEKGEVEFSLELMLAEPYIHSRPPTVSGGPLPSGEGSL